MSNAVAKKNGTNITPISTPETQGEIMENVLIRGDLSQLSAEERAKYYLSVCKSIGLNPSTKPFEYIVLNGRMTLYARKDAADQLRTIHNVSVTDLVESERDGVFIVTAKVINGDGRTDAAKGAVNITGLKGEALANAMMKAETKAKRRATLSLCGLGFLDETEIEDIPEKEKRTTLPKKDAKDIFTRLQSEVDKTESREALKKWGTENADRIKVLPEDWQDILRLRYEEKLADLRQQETNSPPPYPSPKTNLLEFKGFVIAKLQAAKSTDELVIVWDTFVEPNNKEIFPPDAADLMSVFRQCEINVGTA